MRTFLAVLIGKAARAFIRLFRRGGGSALPGTIAAAIQPKLLTNAIRSARLGLVVVSGTAGKSTTTKILVELLRAHGLKVFTNPSTANIKQGLYAAVLQFCDLKGRIPSDIVVFEWDEGHGAALAEELKPRIAVLTNVLSDQLDRFVDPELVIEKLQKIHDEAEVVIANVDDKNLAQFVNPIKTKGFGLADEIKDRPDYALNFGPHPKIKQAATVIGLTDRRATFDFAGEVLELPLAGQGAHQALNTAGAVLAVRQIVQADMEIVRRTLLEMPGVFARDEIAEIRGRGVRLMLVQNPTSFQLNLDGISGSEVPLMLMAGGDIHDPSWLWGVNFRKIGHVDVVGGRNAYDLALVLEYQGIPFDQVITDAGEAAEAFLALDGNQPTILFSADAMRRTRRHLGLAK